ncbi:MAG TPA: hypothetical protein PKZ88_08355 [Methanothermobacter sp.]|nr:hypothetical protein [Methanothermobacter sp.]
MRLPKRIYYDNLEFKVVEVSSADLNGSGPGNKVSHIDMREGIIYVDSSLKEDLKVRCVVMDLLELSALENGEKISNKDLIMSTRIVLDLIRSFLENEGDNNQNSVNLNYIS